MDKAQQILTDHNRARHLMLFLSAIFSIPSAGLALLGLTQHGSFFPFTTWLPA